MDRYATAWRSVTRVRETDVMEKTPAEYAAEFKARKAAMRDRMRHNALNGIVTPGERAILDQEKAENKMERHEQSL